MGFSIAARAQVDSSFEPASVVRILRRIVTGLVRPLVDLKALPAILEHFRHKRHAIKLSLGIERGQYFCLASNLDPVSNAQLMFHLMFENPT